MKARQRCGLVFFILGWGMFLEILTVSVNVPVDMGGIYASLGMIVVGVVAFLLD